MKKYMIGSIILLLVVGAWFLKRENKEETVVDGALTIVLTEEGFSPDVVHIRNGTEVTFTTTTGKFFWPASDLHPSHGIYPAFDPKEPLVATESWSFVFDTPGEWSFHDHLSPYYTGVITVVP